MGSDPKPSFVTPFHSRPRRRSAAAHDATLEFAAEIGSEPGTASLGRGRGWLAVAVAAVVVALAAAVAWAWALATSTATETLRVYSEPAGIEVRVDGEPRGTTPLETGLPVGPHAVEVGQGSAVRRFPVDVSGGTNHTIHVALAPAEPEAAPTGSLTVTSDTPGHGVSVGGVQSGTTPVLLDGLAAGDHEVVVDMGGTTARRRVEIVPGVTSSIHVAERPVARWGWLTVSSPFPIRVLQGGRLIGTSEIDQIRLPPGDHDLELLAEPFGVRQAVRVRITPGAPAAITPDIPQVTLSLSATPSAEVIIDGVLVGDTPLPNVSVPVGDHAVVFRHPVLGEKHQIVRVTPQGPKAISVDMTTR